MSKENILNFAKNLNGSEMGVMYDYSINENNEVVIQWAFDVGNQKNSRLKFYGDQSPIAPPAEVKKALSAYVAKHGKRQFDIKLIYENAGEN